MISYVRTISIDTYSSDYDDSNENTNPDNIIVQSCFVENIISKSKKIESYLNKILGPYDSEKNRNEAEEEKNELIIDDFEHEIICRFDKRVYIRLFDFSIENDFEDDVAKEENNAGNGNEKIIQDYIEKIDGFKFTTNTWVNLFDASLAQNMIIIPNFKTNLIRISTKKDIKKFCKIGK